MTLFSIDPEVEVLRFLLARDPLILKAEARGFVFEITLPPESAKILTTDTSSCSVERGVTCH